MKLRAHKIIPDTRKLIELLQNTPLSALPKGVLEGHNGRLDFLRRCWEESRWVRSSDKEGLKDKLEDWVLLDEEAVDAEKWEEVEWRV